MGTVDRSANWIAAHAELHESSPHTRTAINGIRPGLGSGNTAIVVCSFLTGSVIARALRGNFRPREGRSRSIVGGFSGVSPMSTRSDDRHPLECAKRSYGAFKPLVLPTVCRSATRRTDAASAEEGLSTGGLSRIRTWEVTRPCNFPGSCILLDSHIPYGSLINTRLEYKHLGSRSANPRVVLSRCLGLADMWS